MIGEEIRRLADAKGLMTQQAIADATGLSQSFVARLLAGQRPNLTADVLYKLSDGLGVKCEHWRSFIADEPVVEDKPKGKRN